eukprot:COSAG05_NODE_787_length_7335_cov_30.078220_5_plen_83_part_00
MLALWGGASACNSALQGGQYPQYQTEVDGEYKLYHMRTPTHCNYHPVMCGTQYARAGLSPYKACCWRSLARLLRVMCHVRSQ